jgi:hypothetical protein
MKRKQQSARCANVSGYLAQRSLEVSSCMTGDLKTAV